MFRKRKKRKKNKERKKKKKKKKIKQQRFLTLKVKTQQNRCSNNNVINSFLGFSYCDDR
jgi:hypothetical protein